MDAERFPIDYDRLTKGTVIGADVVEKFRAVKCPQTDFEFARLQLRDLVRRELSIRGVSVVIVNDGEGLRILNDAEAATYTSERFHLRLRQALRQFGDQMSVDVTQLTDDERRQHERSVEINGKYAQALAQAGSRYQRMTSHQRATPGLPGPVGQ
jgi:uridine kinase